MKQNTAVSILILVLFLSSCAPRQTSVSSTPTENVVANTKENLPVFPNAVESKDKAVSYHYTVENADIDTVQQFYKEQMQAAGWKLLGIGDVSGTDIGKAYTIWLVKGQEVASVDIFTKSNAIHIMIHFDPTAP